MSSFNLDKDKCINTDKNFGMYAWANIIVSLVLFISGIFITKYFDINVFITPNNNEYDPLLGFMIINSAIITINSIFMLIKHNSNNKKINDYNNKIIKYENDLKVYNVKIKEYRNNNQNATESDFNNDKPEKPEEPEKPENLWCITNTYFWINIALIILTICYNVYKIYKEKKKQQD